MNNRGPKLSPTLGASEQKYFTCFCLGYSILGMEQLSEEVLRLNKRAQDGEMHPSVIPSIPSNSDFEPNDRRDKLSRKVSHSTVKDFKFKPDQSSIF